MPASTARTSFIGRRSELATLRRLLGSTRLLTMVGAGGFGKNPLSMGVGPTAKRHGVAAVCRRLDGMPLALELAAARLRHFDIGTIETLLARPLELLSGQDGNPEPRHRTIRATIDWSYELLFENDRRLLRRLAVFAGGFTLEAAAAVLVDETATGADVAEPVSRLVDQSLVEFDRMTLRYRLLEPGRE